MGTQTAGKRAGVSRQTSAFTLIELLVVLAVVLVLAGVGLSGLASSLQHSRTVQCFSKMRSLGGAVLFYAADHDGEFPRSMHSGGSWAEATLPYLGVNLPVAPLQWPETFERLHRCPSDGRRSVSCWSYGLNVYFELDPMRGDDYDSAPATWRRVAMVAKPGRTILLVELRPSSIDHVMPHLWTGTRGAKNALASDRHRKRANYVFVDGHIEGLPLEDVYDRARSIDLFDPALAR